MEINILLASDSCKHLINDTAKAKLSHVNWQIRLKGQSVVIQQQMFKEIFQGTWNKYIPTRKKNCKERYLSLAYQ